MGDSNSLLIIIVFFAQGVKAVITESFERIHRSNLVGMGIMPLEYLPGQNAESLGLTGKESYTIEIPEDMKTGQLLDVKVGSQTNVPFTRDINLLAAK